MERITRITAEPTTAELMQIIASMAAELRQIREELKRLTPSITITNSTVSVNYNSPNATATNISDNQIAIGENNAVNRETNIKDNQVAIGNEVNGSNNGLATRIHNQANGNNNTIAEQNGTNNRDCEIHTQTNGTDNRTEITEQITPTGRDTAATIATP